MNFITEPLSELLINFDSKRIPLSSRERECKKGIYPYYGATSVLDYVDEYIFDGTYILLGEDGTVINADGSPVLQLANGKFWCNNHAHILKNTDKVDFYFLYYLLKNCNVSSIVTGAVQPKISQKNLYSFVVSYPKDKEIQQKIAHILRLIDNKIELNQQQNNNLEQQAQALFKSWFVDKLNPNRKTIRAEEFFNISIGKTPPRKEPEWFSENSNDVKWVSISDMGNCGMFISDSSEYLISSAISKFNVKLVPSNTVLLSFKLTVGRIAMTDGEMTTNEAIAHFVTNKTEINEYLYCYLKNFNFQTMGSTSSIATAVNSKIIKSMPFVMPEENELKDFHSVVFPMFAQIKFNQQENTRLAQLRDTLLPKLMSGEIDVSKVNISADKLSFTEE